MDCGSDGAPTDRLIAGALVPGDQQQEAVAARDCPIQRSIDCPPGTIEAHSMKVDNAIGLDRSVSQAPIPAAVERRSRRTALVAHRSSRFRKAPGGLREGHDPSCEFHRVAVVFVA